MNNERRDKKRRHGGGDGNEPRLPAERKRHSVLIRRSILFTLLVFLVGLLVGSPVYHLTAAVGWGPFWSV